MADVRVISVCEDTSILGSDWDEVSWPIHRSAGFTCLVGGRYRLEELSNFWWTFTVMPIVRVSVIADLSRVTPRTFGVTGESMDEDNTARLLRDRR